MGKTSKKFVVTVNEQGLMGSRATPVSRHRQLARARQRAATVAKRGYNTSIYKVTKNAQGKIKVSRVKKR